MQLIYSKRHEHDCIAELLLTVIIKCQKFSKPFSPLATAIVCPCEVVVLLFTTRIPVNKKM
jgi:hypothetical protein